MVVGCTETPASCLAIASNCERGKSDEGSMDQVNLSPQLNMCSAGSRAASASPGEKESLFIALLYMHSCDQIARGDRSGCCFCARYTIRFCSGFFSFECCHFFCTIEAVILQTLVSFFPPRHQIQLLATPFSLILNSFHKTSFILNSFTGYHSVDSLNTSCA